MRVDTFIYAGHPTGLMQQKEVESSEYDPERLFLSQDIGEFFANALRKELTSAGYKASPDSTRTVSGTIEQFFLDYVGGQEQRFQIQTLFEVSRQGGPPFVTSCRSERQQAKDWMKSGSLIEHGVRDCIEAFVKEAQAAGAL